MPKNAKKCQKYVCINITKNAVNKLTMKTFITRKYKILTNTYTYTYKKNAKKYHKNCLNSKTLYNSNWTFLNCPF